MNQCFKAENPNSTVEKTNQMSNIPPETNAYILKEKRNTL